MFVTIYHAHLDDGVIRLALARDGAERLAGLLCGGLVPAVVGEDERRAHHSPSHSVVYFSSHTIITPPPLNPMPHDQTNVSWTRSLQRHTHMPHWTEKLSKLNAL